MAGVLDIAKSIALSGWKEASNLPTRGFHGKIGFPSEASRVRALPGRASHRHSTVQTGPNVSPCGSTGGSPGLLGVYLTFKGAMESSSRKSSPC